MEMKILVLNGSPHPQGSTKDMVNAFKKGAESAGHIVDVVDVCKKKIGGCLICMRVLFSRSRETFWIILDLKTWVCLQHMGLKTRARKREKN